MHKQLTFLACAVAAAALPAADQSADAINIPFNKLRSLEPRANGEIDTAAFIRELNYTLAKYKARPLPQASGSLLQTLTGNIGGILSRRQSNVPLTDQVEAGPVDELYYGPITVGATGPQVFTTDFDTGSADLFVPGPKCGTAQGCTGNVKYDQEGTDQHKTTSVTYGSGQVAGENYFDDVTVGGLTAHNANLISLTTAQGFSGSAASSLMGMGFSTISNSKQPTFFEILIKQGTVKTQEFSFFLGRAASGSQGRSELTLGGRDSSRYTGAFTKVPVTQKGYWQVAVDGVKVANGTPLVGTIVSPATAGQAAIDTGTTAIIAPTVAALAIFSQIPGAFPVPLASGSPTETIFAYPCNSKATVSFVFAGKSFVVNPQDMSLGSLTSGFAEAIGELFGESGGNAKLQSAAQQGLCASTIIGADLNPGEELYVVGDAFLKNWYSVYDYTGPSVQFAKSNA